MKDGEKIIFKDESCKNEELEEIRVILQCISDNMFMSPEVGINRQGTYFLSGESITAAENTICSIDFCCTKGFFSDAFTLVRKYRDDIIQYIFVANIIEHMHGLSEEESNEYFKSGLTEESMYAAIIKEVQILSGGNQKSASEIAIELWLQGKLDRDDYFKERKEYFDTSKYMSFLKDDTDVCILFDQFLQPIWKKTDRVLNNYVHANGRKYIIDNYPSYGDYARRKNDLITVVRNVTSIFLSILVLVQPNKVQSCDYRDYMECNSKPPEDCQYWVTPIIVEYMDKYFNDINSGLLDFLEKRNKYGMKLLLKDYEGE